MEGNSTVDDCTVENTVELTDPLADDLEHTVAVQMLVETTSEEIKVEANYAIGPAGDTVLTSWGAEFDNAQVIPGESWGDAETVGFEYDADSFAADAQAHATDHVGDVVSELVEHKTEHDWRDLEHIFGIDGGA